MYNAVIDAETSDYTTVISTADLKAHLRVTHSDEDGLISAYRTAACQFVEAYCNTRLTNVEVYVDFSGFAALLEIPVGPTIRVNSVQYKTSKTADYTTLDGSEYYVEKGRKPAVIKLITSPSVDSENPSPVRVSVDTGYQVTPEALVQAVRFLVAHYYEHRQAAEAASIKEIPLGIFSLMEPYRILSFK